MADQPEKTPAQQDSSQQAKAKEADQNQKTTASGDAPKATEAQKPASSAPAVKPAEPVASPPAQPPVPQPPAAKSAEPAAPAAKPAEPAPAQPPAAKPAEPAAKPVQPVSPAAAQPPAAKPAEPAPAQPPAAKPAEPAAAQPPAAKPAEPAAKPDPSLTESAGAALGVTRNFSNFKDATSPSKATAAEQAAAGKEETQVSSTTGQSRPIQRMPESSAPTQSAGQICPTCGHRNRPGVLICENCGTNLMTGSKTAVGTRDLVREQEERKGEPGGGKLLDTDQVKAIESAGAAVFTEEMVLRIEIEGGTTPMMVYPKNEIIMGRRDPNTGGMPDVDLTSYAGYRMGVSRRHAAIRLQDSQLNVSDLGSSNGTFLNGTRLSAHRPYQVRDGDEIRLGQMVLRVYFQSAKDKK